MANNNRIYNRSNYSFKEYLDVASFKLFSKKSWKEWEELRKYHQAPVLKRKILDTYKEVLDMYQIQITDFEDDDPLGSYVNLPLFFENFLLEYRYRGWISQEKVLYFKISFDNTKLTKVGSEGLWIVPTNVNKPQSANHCWEIGRYRGSETRRSIKKVCEEMEVNSFLEEYQHAKIGDQTVSFFISADWIALVAMFWVPIPNSRNWNSTTCMFCSCPKEMFKIGYLDDPFSYILLDTQVEDFPDFPLQALTMDDIHYDPMHGVARVLTLFIAQISRITLQGEKGRYRELITYFIGANYTINIDTPQGFSPKQMKSLIGKNNRDRFLENLLTFFDDQNANLINLNQENLHTLTESNNIEILMQSLFTFYDFSYKKYPTAEDVIKLDKSRTVILGVFSNYQWNMEVSVHYILNHMIEKLNYFKFEKGSTTVAPNLCEGTEQENYQAKLEKTVLGSDLPGIANATHRSRKRVERKTLKLIFTFLKSNNCFEFKPYEIPADEMELMEYDWMRYIASSPFILDQIAHYVTYEELDLD